MKQKRLTKACSALIALIMVILMIPFSAIPTSASIIDQTDDLGYLGEGYNMLGNEPLKSTAFIHTDNIFNADLILNYISAEKTDTNSTDYSYIYKGYEQLYEKIVSFFRFKL